VQAVLTDILATPITPELRRPGKGARISQRSEDLVDRTNCTTSSCTTSCASARTRTGLRLCLHALAGTYELAEIRKWLLAFPDAFFASQSNATCVPDGPKVGSGGSRLPPSDWRMAGRCVARFLARGGAVHPKQSS